MWSAFDRVLLAHERPPAGIAGDLDLFKVRVAVALPHLGEVLPEAVTAAEVILASVCPARSDRLGLAAPRTVDLNAAVVVVALPTTEDPLVGHAHHLELVPAGLAGLRLVLVLGAARWRRDVVVVHPVTNRLDRAVELGSDLGEGEPVADAFRWKT